MPDLDYSIVIPTHNRMDILPDVLSALGQQADAPPFEVILIDDGSTDGTGPWLKQCRVNFPLTVIHQKAQGPAAARNAGVRAAKGHRVAFLGDDTVPTEDWLKSHHACAAEDVAVLGYTCWHPKMESNRFLTWLNDYGKQFGYRLIANYEDVPFNFFYTSNLSLPKALLLEEPFCEEFPYPAWEDIEVGYRLVHSRRLRLVYQPRAVALHFHPTELVRFCERQGRAGESAVLFSKLHPELGQWLGVPVTAPRAAVWREPFAYLARRLCQLGLGFPKLWDWLLNHHYRRGVRRALLEL